MVAATLRQNQRVKDSQTVAAVILAAGASRRFRSPKQLAMLHGRTLLDAVVDAARGAGLSPVLAVVSPGLPAPPGATAVVNDHPEQGLSHSLQLGFESLAPHVEAAVILLGDQPTVRVATIRALLSHPDAGRTVVVSRAEGRIGPPILLRRPAFGLVDEAAGDSGLARVLARHSELVTYLDVETHLPDVDAPRDLERLAATEPPPPH